MEAVKALPTSIKEMDNLGPRHRGAWALHQKKGVNGDQEGD